MQLILNLDPEKYSSEVLFERHADESLRARFVAAGANIVYLAIKLAMGEEFAVPTVKDGVTTVRYMEEMYVQGGQVIELPD